MNRDAAVGVGVGLAVLFGASNLPKSPTVGSASELDRIGFSNSASFARSNGVDLALRSLIGSVRDHLHSPEFNHASPDIDFIRSVRVQIYSMDQSLQELKRGGSVTESDSSRIDQCHQCFLAAHVSTSLWEGVGFTFDPSVYQINWNTYERLEDAFHALHPELPLMTWRRTTTESHGMEIDKYVGEYVYKGVDHRLLPNPLTTGGPDIDPAIEAAFRTYSEVIVLPPIPENAPSFRMERLGKHR